MTARWPEDAGVEDKLYAKTLGARLRAVRTQQYQSLRGVERNSGGRWKAAALGSYERGDRALLVQRLCELADFYGVAVSDLLPAGGGPLPGAGAVSPARIVLNLDKVAALSDPTAQLLCCLAASIQRQRGGVKMGTLGVRREDLRTVALMYDSTFEALTKRLVRWQVLASESAITGDEL
jgi:transcriptional regulator with XRE-family HTH domain